MKARKFVYLFVWLNALFSGNIGSNSKTIYVLDSIFPYIDDVNFSLPFTSWQELQIQKQFDKIKQNAFMRDWPEKAMKINRNKVTNFTPEKTISSKNIIIRIIRT